MTTTDIDKSKVTQILGEIVGGNAGEVDRLFPLVYDELRNMARGQLAQRPPAATLQPTMVVHDVYLRLVDQSQLNVNSETHFKAIAARAMRCYLVDHLRRVTAKKRGGGAQRVTLSEAQIAAPSRDVDGDELAVALEELRALDDRLASVLELRVLGGLTMNETATALGLARSTVSEDWRSARAWLLCRLDESDTGRPT